MAFYISVRIKDTLAILARDTIPSGKVMSTPGLSATALRGRPYAGWAAPKDLRDHKISTPAEARSSRENSGKRRTPAREDCARVEVLVC